MRYIDAQLVGGNLPEGWEQKVKEAENAVTGAQPEDRSAEVNRHSQLWKDLRDTLKGASNDKCWYCESIDIRSDNAVDHFRPKNAVAECIDHEGYWWLAFKWDNLRFCCTYCNCRRVDQAKGQGGGKADHFPLKDEARRAKTQADDLHDEEPLLLDPTVPADPTFLWFDETGQPVPNPVFGNDANSYPYKRAKTSIRLYHLDHTEVVERRKLLCSEIRRRVEEADRYFEKYDTGDGTARQAFEDVVRNLRGQLAADAPYSATARAMLMGLRGTHPVADVLLLAV